VTGNPRRSEPSRVFRRNFMDYSKTVNLPKTDFPMKADLPKREPAMLERWEKERVYEKALERRKGKERFILHDGPPYANGHLHLGHALNKILKDIVVRYKTMDGYYAPYVPGWDCHGLPIELQLMKELKLTDKHKVDRVKFRQQAKAFAEKFVNIQREEFKRMGVLGDWDHPYLTMDPAYEKVIVDSFLELEKKGYIYRGKKPFYWCYVDETALADAEVEYEDISSPSLYVAFPVQIGMAASEKAKDKARAWDLKRTKFAVWTTTPWTLPANVAIAINPTATYILCEDVNNKSRYILAQNLFDNFQIDGGIVATKMDEFSGEFLASNFEAKHPWIERKVPILSAGFVALDTGTGLVHIAPGHGVEDYRLGQKQNPPLPILSPVDDKGCFTDEVPQWKGKNVFLADPLIIEHLRKIGAYIKDNKITHSYPHCWRCHKPVIFRATEQWFLDIDHSNLRQQLLEEIGRIDKNKGWIPTYGKSRIEGMVETRPDWCLSRQRLWGTEIPASSEQRAASVEKKEPDIVDVWFESGVSWAAVLKPRNEFPADMYLEGSDQHRGWFQTSLVPAVALTGQAPYKSVLTHGFVMDGEGRPMSKSLGNVISPQEIIEEYGADVLRLWVASSDYGGDVRLSPEILKGLAETYRKVRNTFRYLLGNLSDFHPGTDQVAVAALHKDIDRWALRVLQDKVKQIRNAYDRYEFHRATGALVDFCVQDLSGLYLDILKDRLYCDPPHSKSRRSAQTVLFHIAEALIRLCVPILPFTADEAWRSLRHQESVALADLPQPSLEPVNDGLGYEWQHVWDLRSQVLQMIEEQRRAGRIGGSLEAWVSVSSRSPNYLKLLERIEGDLPMLFIVSKVSIEPDQPHKVTVRHAKEAGCKKCARCWNWRLDVGTGEICGRCAAAVEEWKKVHPEFASGAKS
jgi:isoleucyl-tRNA synthetase